MSHGDFSKKHGPDRQPDPAIKAEILKRAKENTLSCAEAFDIAKALKTPPKEVGVAIDLMNFRITKCQLGLFGYPKKKKKVKPLESMDADLKTQIEEEAENNRLPCKTVWAIGARFAVPKMRVSNACETLGVKIKSCQLGAF